jgi:hypothetical protein
MGTMRSTATARTVHDFRREWLLRLLAEFGGGVEAFAEAVGRNSKHLSALKAGRKAMGSNVARDIENRLMQRRGSKVWPGMLDSDPDATRVAESKPEPYVQAGQGAASQPLSDDALTMAIQTVIELLTLRRGTLPADKQARFIRLVYDMAVNGVPKAQIVPLLREAIANTPEVDSP